MTYGLWPARLLHPWDSPGENTGVPCSPPEESFQPRDWTWVSCIAGRFFTIWAAREDLGDRVGLPPQTCLIPGPVLLLGFNSVELHFLQYASGTNLKTMILTLFQTDQCMRKQQVIPKTTSGLCKGRDLNTQAHCTVTNMRKCPGQLYQDSIKEMNGTGDRSL